jgi:hypothetical protein
MAAGSFSSATPAPQNHHHRGLAADLFGSRADRKAQLIRGQCVPLGGDGL